GSPARRGFGGWTGGVLDGLDREQDNQRQKRQHEHPDQSPFALAQLEQVGARHPQRDRGHAGASSRISCPSAPSRVVTARKRCSRLRRTGSSRLTASPARTSCALIWAAVSGPPPSTTRRPSSERRAFRTCSRLSSSGRARSGSSTSTISSCRAPPSAS